MFTFMKKPAVLRAYLLGREHSDECSKALNLAYSDVGIKEIYAHLDKLNVLQLKINHLYKCKDIVHTRGNWLIRASHFIGQTSHPLDFLYVKSEEIRQQEEDKREKPLENLLE